MNSSGCGFLGRDEGLSLCSRHSLLEDKLASPSPRTGINVGRRSKESGDWRVERERTGEGEDRRGRGQGG